MQRDVEVEFDSIDKSGGFVGIMFHNKENVALELVKNGFAMVHPYSADSLSWARQLYDAEVKFPKTNYFVSDDVLVPVAS